MQKVWTIIELINWGTDFFKEKHIESQRLNIELLLCEVIKCERLYLYTNFDKPLSEQELSQLREYVKRRASGEPLQYILGNVDFHKLKFNVNSSVLIPRPETEQLVEIIVSHNSEKKNLRILEIGTGSGCIAISLAKFLPESEVFALDISQEALQTAKENASLNEVKNVFFKKIDILNEIPQKKYDIIVSNPPYIPLLDYKQLEKEIFFEPEIALTDKNDGLDFYKRFADIFPAMLDESANFYLELGDTTHLEIANIFNLSKFNINLVNDFRQIKRFVVGSLKRE